MSIAVSAVVKPSRCLRALVGGYALVNLAAAFALGWLWRERFALAPLCAAAFLLAAACLGRAAGARAKTRRIDISGVGRLRLTVQQDVGSAGARPPPAGETARLLADSTVWPQLLMLRLRTEDGVRSLALLPDSVGPEAFRRLAVAVGALGARNKPLQGTDKIL
jgi:toxin CptA